MKIQYFQNTDTLYIEFKQNKVAETRDLDENTLLDVDKKGNIVAITVEHASQRADFPKLSYEQVADDQTAQTLRERRADYRKR